MEGFQERKFCGRWDVGVEDRMVMVRLAVISISATSMCLVLMAGASDFTHKFVRVAVGPCSINYVDPDVKDSQFCCSWDDLSPPCYPGMPLCWFLGTWYGAWLTPLVLPLISLLIVSCQSHPSEGCSSSASATTTSKGTLSASSSTSCSAPSQVRTAMSIFPSWKESVRVMRRCLFYLCMFCLRYWVLYLVPHSYRSEKRITDDCWYADLRASGQCPPPLDVSDHVPLFTIHLGMVATVEICALLHHGTFPERRVRAAMLTCFPLCYHVGGLYLLYHTAKSFHYPLESAYGGVMSLTLLVPISHILLRDAKCTEKLIGACYDADNMNYQNFVATHNLKSNVKKNGKGVMLMKNLASGNNHSASTAEESLLPKGSGHTDVVQGVNV